MDIIIQPQITVTLNQINILAVRDLFEKKQIIARIDGLERPVILWNGPDEYASAGNWTNDTALARAQEVLALSAVPWAF
jgi:hypothetical protein